MLITFDLYCVIDINQCFVYLTFLHIQVCTIFKVDMIIWAQTYCLIIAFYCIVETTEFYLGEGPVVVEEVVWWARFESQIVRYNSLLIFFQAKANITIIAQKHLIIRLLSNSFFIVMLGFEYILQAQKTISSIIKITTSGTHLNGFIILMNSIIKVSNSFIAIAQQKKHLRINNSSILHYILSLKYSFLISTIIIQILRVNELAFKVNFRHGLILHFELVEKFLYYLWEFYFPRSQRWLLFLFCFFTCKKRNIRFHLGQFLLKILQFRDPQAYSFRKYNLFIFISKSILLKKQGNRIIKIPTERTKLPIQIFLNFLYIE